MQIKTLPLLWRLLGIATILLTGLIALPHSVMAQVVPGNLISNPSVENASANPAIPQDWYKDFWGTNTRSFGYVSPGQDGSKAVKIQINSIVSGDAKWAFNDVTVTPGQTYRYSDYYQSNVSSYLVIRYLMKSGSYRYVDLATLAPAASWTQVSTTFVPPTNAIAMTVYHLINSRGWLTTDNFFLNFNGVTPSPTPDPTPTSPPVITNTPTPTPTQPIPSNTLAPTVAAPSLTPTNTVTPSVSTPTPTNTPTPTENLPSPTATNTPTPTYIISSPTPTNSPTPTSVSSSPTPTSTLTPTPTPSTGIASPTPTPTIVPTGIPTITPTPTNPPATTNMIINPSLETSTSGSAPDNWLTGNWGTNTTVFTYPVAGIDGAKAAKVDISQYTSGDSKWFFQDVNVLPNTNYHFSDSYQSTVGSQLIIRYTAQNTGSVSYELLASLSPSAGWTTTNQTFTTPTGVQSLTIFHLIAGVGSLTVDNFALAQAPTPTPTPTPPTFSRGMVSLDFDDGWQSTFENGIPILDAAGYKSTQYIITQYMANAPGYATEAQVKQMAADGHDIEAHSQTHPDLTLLTPTQLNTEVCGSRQDLINIGITPVALAFPYGTWNQTVVDMVKSCGFAASRTALIEDGGLNYANQNPYLLRTEDVESATTLADVQAFINEAASSKTWLILVLHSVAGDGTQYDTSPAKLQSIVNYLKTSNVDVVTVKQGLAKLQP